MTTKDYVATFYVRKTAKGSFAGGGALVDTFKKNISAINMQSAAKKAQAIADDRNRAWLAKGNFTTVNYTMCRSI